MTTATIPTADLHAAYQGSWYFIAGCGGDLSEWTDGITNALTSRGIGAPSAWYVTTGQAVNDYAQATNDPFPPELVCLLFPLEGLDVGKLALFKLAAGDRWFDDVIDNMRPEGFTPTAPSKNASEASTGVKYPEGDRGTDRPRQQRLRHHRRCQPGASPPGRPRRRQRVRGSRHSQRLLRRAAVRGHGHRRSVVDAP